MKQFNLLLILIFVAMSSLIAQPGTLPRAFDGLSEKAPLNYDLGEKVRFQPLHFDYRDSTKIPYVVLGRFGGEVKRDGKIFRLDQLELALYTIDTDYDTHPCYLVEKAYINRKQTKGKNLHIDIVLDAWDNFDKPIQDRRIKQGKAEFTMTEKINVHKDGRIYFHIKGDEDVKIPGDGGKAHIKGRHCNGVPTFPEEEDGP